MKISNYRRSVQGFQGHQLQRNSQNSKKREIPSIKFLTFKQRASIFHELLEMNSKHELEKNIQIENKKAQKRIKGTQIKTKQQQKRQRYSFPYEIDKGSKSYNSYPLLQRQQEIKIRLKKKQSRGSHISLQQKVAQSIRKMKQKMFLPRITSEDCQNNQNQSLYNLNKKDILIAQTNQKQANANLLQIKNSLKSTLRIYKKELNKCNETIYKPKQIIRKLKNDRLMAPQLYKLQRKISKNKTQQNECKSKAVDKQNLGRWVLSQEIYGFQYDEFES